MKKLYIAALTLTLAFFAKGQTQITFYTNLGVFQAEMFDSLMPITTGNFISLVDSQFYDGIIFHRVIPNFVIQGGDPLGTGYGGPGYTIPDEFDSTGTLSNIKQTISMANAGPNTGGSQFFINLKNNTFLDYDKPPTTSAHPIFGIVRAGWNIVDSIAHVPTDANDRPLTPVVMDSVRVTGSYLSVKEPLSNTVKACIYPNPTTAESILDITATNEEVVHVSIVSLAGTVLANQTLILQSGKNKIPLKTLQVSELPQGMYTVVISGTTLAYTLRITTID